MENTAGKLKVIYGDWTMGLKGEGFHYIFSYQKGSMESLKKNGKEWIYRSPMPAFWRAETDNDRGCSFSTRAAMWLGADLFRKFIRISVCVDGNPIEFPSHPVNNRYSNHEYADSVDLCATFETCTVPSTEVDVNWHVEADGRITVRFLYHGKAGLPELPALGLRFVMPTKAVGFDYEGLSGETYPDRMAGGVPGVYHIDGLPVTPYMRPQDCGVHMDTRWLEVRRATTLNNADPDQEEFTLRFEEAGRPFAFSCLPFTPEEIENAEHMEELPPERRTVVTVYAAVRGVGGIDSWGSDVEEPYHISAEQDHELSFSIK